MTLNPVPVVLAPKLTVLLSFVLAATALQAASASSKLEKGWVLDQNSNFNGQQVITVTPTAIKSVAKSGAITIIARAPNWDVLVMNNRDHTFIRTSVDRFVGGSSGRIFSTQREQLSTVRWNKQPDERMKGYKLHKLSAVRHAPRVERSANEERFALAHYSLSSATIYTLPDIVLSKPMARLISKLLVTPELNNLPIELRYKDAGGADATGLTTRSLKQALLSSSQFAAPTGYRNVGSEEQIYFDKQSEELLHGCYDWSEHVDPDSHDRDESYRMRVPHFSSIK